MARDDVNLLEWTCFWHMPSAEFAKHIRATSCDACAHVFGSEQKDVQARRFQR